MNLREFRKVVAEVVAKTSPEEIPDPEVLQIVIEGLDLDEYDIEYNPHTKYVELFLKEK